MALNETMSLLTAEAFHSAQLAQPERCELVAGEVVALSPVKRPHARTTLRIGALILAHADAHGGEALVGDPGYQLDEMTVRAPDVAYHRSPPPEVPTWILEPPTLVVEVISPNDRWTEVEVKTLQWLDFGVEEVWLVDSRSQTLVIRRSDAPALHLTQAERLTSQALPGFEVAVAVLLSHEPEAREG